MRKCYFSYIVDTIYALRWNPSGLKTTPLSTISLKESFSDTGIDVHLGEQIIVIKDISERVISLTIYCFISGYNAQSKIEFSFCKVSNRI